jgi:hypothetical protein
VRWIVCFTLFALGCNGGNALYVEIVTELCPDVIGGPRCLEERFDEVVVSIDRANQISRPVEAGDDYLEGQRVAEFVELMAGTYSVTVEVRRAGVVIARTVRGVVLSGASQVIQIAIQSDCAGVMCPMAGDDPAATECVAGGCVDPRCFEAGADLAGCGALCDETSPCAPSVPCAEARCVEHICIERMNPALCAEGERCLREIGCFGGVIEGDPCEADDDCGETELICCGRECRQPNCEDGNPCTDDACTRNGCENTPADGACDDSVYCNGADSCVAGRCEQHAGSPCGAGICEETLDMCVSCVTDADCPAVAEAPIGGCFTEGDTCDESGMQTWRITSYTCAANMCMPSTRDEQRPCAIDRTGISCSVTDDSTCGGGVCGCGGLVCGGGQYCRAGGCYDYPWFEPIGFPTPACVDAARGAEPGDLAGYILHGRPGAPVHKFNRHVSCGAGWVEAPETSGTPVFINGAGVFEVRIDTPGPLPCDFDNLGLFEQYAEVDGLRVPAFGVIEQTLYNSGASCSAGVQSCSAARTFCP